MIGCISDFCKEFQYPTDAEKVLLTAYDKIMGNQAAKDIFLRHVEMYNDDKLTDYESVLGLIDEAADLAGAHKYTVNLLFLMCLSKHAKELYKKKNISMGIYYDSMCDLKWKLQECYNVHNIYGTFAGSWFWRFFDLTRFALGRLQFELIKFDRTYSKSGYVLNSDDMVLNVHIPSCGPLKHEDCIESYKKASEFFKSSFEGRPTAFCCNSWLLYPKHYEFLPKTSNILKFMNDFDIISSSVDKEFSNMWRIFNKKYTGDVNELPCDTSLQRAYADWIRKGNEVGGGFGVMLFDGEKVIN